MPENVIPTSPEALRLLRLRALLDEAATLTQEAIIETTVSDTWAIALVNGANELNRARAVVLSSIKALKAPVNEVIE